ncbi:diguanylate cyclase domain-containing protein [Teredinibacter turnerae]|uniref:sensor domain-containing diguanylate cyclase n=1 Tax=Teredinibacter turnerae TaxID=2426 RepID=UPI000360ED1D|nr:diguanylate cyclase [Teredinibacter turnerae]
MANSATIHSDDHFDFTPADICAGFVLFLCSLVMMGWLANIDILRNFAFFAFYPAMPLVNAVGMMVLAIAVGALRRGLSQIIWLSAITSLLLSIGNFAELYGDTSLGLHHLFITHSESHSSISSAVGFALAAITLPLSQQPAFTQRKTFIGLLLFNALLPLSAILAYTSNAYAAARASLFDGYSLPEALSHLLLVAGIGLTTPNRLHASLFADHPDAAALRKYALTLLVFVLATTLLTTHLSIQLRFGPVLIFALYAATLLLSLVAFLAITYSRTPSQVRTVTDLEGAHAHQEQLLAFVEESGDGILMVDNTGTLRYANSTCSKMFGYSQDEFVGMRLNELIPKRFRAKHLEHFAHFFAAHPAEKKYVKRGRLTGISKEGIEKALAISLFRREENSLVIATLRELNGLERDIAERMKHIQHDLVTGVPDRQEFGRFCQNHWDQVVRKSERHFCIFVIDLDGLRLINSKYGREFGNAVLQNVAANIKSRQRGGDRLFRYTSDEFIMICSDITPDACELLAERIRTSIKVVPTRLGDNNIYITASVGFTHCNQLPANLMDAVAHITNVLHKQKPDYKDQVVPVAQLPEFK